MKIYVVMGNTGEYSDFRQWPVDAWLDEEKAKARVIELEHLLRVHRVGIGPEFARGEYKRQEEGQEAVRVAENGDPQCKVDYTGTAYEIMQCELKS